MTRSITLDDLRRVRACSVQADRFAHLFPNGATFQTENEAVAAARAVAVQFDWGWAARELLSPPARDAYEAATRPAWEAYKAATRTAREAYKAATAEAFARAWWSDAACTIEDAE